MTDKSNIALCDRTANGKPYCRVVAPKHADLWCAPCLLNELTQLREALTKAFPPVDGYTEAFDRLLEVGLLVAVPADEEYRAEWGDGTMYVWSWSPLALTQESPDE